MCSIFNRRSQARGATLVCNAVATHLRYASTSYILEGKIWGRYDHRVLNLARSSQRLSSSNIARCASALLLGRCEVRWIPDTASNTRGFFDWGRCHCLYASNVCHAGQRRTNAPRFISKVQLGSKVTWSFYRHISLDDCSSHHVSYSRHFMVGDRDVSCLLGNSADLSLLPLRLSTRPTSY